MSLARRASLFLLITILALLSTFDRALLAQGNFVDRYMVKGYDQAGSFGAPLVPGQPGGPFGVYEVSQVSQKVGGPAAPGIVALVDAVTFTGPTTATEVFGIADATGTVTPTSGSFSTPGIVDVAIDGIAVSYEYDPISNLFNIVGMDLGRIHLSSTVSGAIDIDIVRERSTYTVRNGLVNHTMSLKSDFRGRFGYGGTGAVSVWFEGPTNLVIAPAGTTLNVADTRYGFIQSGSLAAQK